MQKAEVNFAALGDPDLLVWKVPAELAIGDVSIQSFALPIQSRSGGFLLAIPLEALSNFAVTLAAIEEDGLLGPSSEFQVSLVEEDEEGGTHPVVRVALFWLLIVMTRS